MHRTRSLHNGCASKKSKLRYSPYFSLLGRTKAPVNRKSHKVLVQDLEKRALLSVPKHEEIFLFLIYKLAIGNKE